MGFAGRVQYDKMRTPILARHVEASQLALSPRLWKKKANLLTGVAFCLGVAVARTQGAVTGSSFSLAASLRPHGNSS